MQRVGHPLFQQGNNLLIEYNGSKQQAIVNNQLQPPYLWSSNTIRATLGGQQYGPPLRGGVLSNFTGSWLKTAFVDGTNLGTCGIANNDASEINTSSLLNAYWGGVNDGHDRKVWAGTQDGDYTKSYGPALNLCTSACQNTPDLGIGVSYLTIALNGNVQGPTSYANTQGWGCALNDDTWRKFNPAKAAQQQRSKLWPTHFNDPRNQPFAYVTPYYNTDRWADVSTDILMTYLLASVNDSNNAINFVLRGQAKQSTADEATQSSNLLGYSMFMSEACSREIDLDSSNCLYPSSSGKCLVMHDKSQKGAVCRVWMFNPNESNSVTSFGALLNAKSNVAAWQSKKFAQTVMGAVNKFCMVNVPNGSFTEGPTPLWFSKKYSTIGNSSNQFLQGDPLEGSTIFSLCNQYYGNPNGQPPAWSDVSLGVDDQIKGQVSDAQTQYCQANPDSWACACLNQTQLGRPWSSEYTALSNAYDKGNIRLGPQNFWWPCRIRSEPNSGKKAFVEPDKSNWAKNDINVCQQIVSMCNNITDSQCTIDRNKINQTLNCKFVENNTSSQSSSSTSNSQQTSNTSTSTTVQVSDAGDWIKKNWVLLVCALVVLIAIVVVVKILVSRSKNGGSQSAKTTG